MDELECLPEEKTSQLKPAPDNTAIDRPRTPKRTLGKQDVMYAVTDNNSTGSGTSKTGNGSRPQRVLACLTCQKRKVKCDRKFPCANCVRHQVECEPALAPRQRRRRFPERDLLNRIRRYEDILRHHHISFEALHPDDAAAASSPAVPAQRASPVCEEIASVTELKEGIRSIPEDARGASSSSNAVDIWNAIKRKQSYHGEDSSNGAAPDSDGDDDEIADAATESAWDRTYHDENHDEFLFGAGSSKASVDLSTLHPEQMQIVRLWQIYLENVSPLLRVTHSPTLQERILDAVGDLTAVSPELEALIFSIYCVAVLSLTGDECFRIFGSPRNQLLAGYQFACRQALLKAKVLRSDNRDCLTALFLYLVRTVLFNGLASPWLSPLVSSCKTSNVPYNQVSVAYDTHPRSMSSMLAVAMHIAQRMGIHMERTYAAYSAFEAEISRRLWWSLVTLDHRICELSEYKTTTMTPEWDCKLPLNLHDFEIRPEMKTAPQAHEEPTEALFAVLQYLHADYLRHSAVHLSSASPCLNKIARPNNGGLTALEQVIEQKYMKSCDPANPLYFMAIWTARGSLARTRLLEHYSSFASPKGQQQQQPGAQQEEAAVSHALTMLECDARLLTSPLARGYTWFVRLHFPMLAYVHVLRYLRRCPSGDTSHRAWHVLGESYAAQAAEPKLADAIFVVCSRLVLQAWDAARRENSSAEVEREEQLGLTMEVPPIVSDMRDKAAHLARVAAGTSGERLAQPTLPMSMDYGSQDIMAFQGCPGSQSGGYIDVSPLGISDVNASHFWDAFHWMPFGLHDQ